MQKKNTQNRLKSYLDLNQLLRSYKGDHEENRTFALSQEKELKPLELLSLWQEKNLFRIKGELESKSYLSYLSSFSFIFSALLLILGFTTGSVLLSYSGAEPVNVIYLLLIMVALPLLSMILSILSMLFGARVSNFFSHLSPLFYLEKFLNFFPFAKKVDFSKLPFSMILSKWLFLERVHFFSALFSLGVLLSLLLMVTTRDIAFGWSSTLQIDATSFQSLLATLSLPWANFFPSAVPSLELVELSHYFRLGENINSDMVQNANKLGAWWQFLVMATLLYALVLRLFFWFFSKQAFSRQLEKEFLALEGVSKLLNEFGTPFVSTQSQKVEQHLKLKELDDSLLTPTLGSKYATVLGWNFSDEELLLAVDHFSLSGTSKEVVGGKNTFSEDLAIVEELKGELLLYVKAWEPPTMDFVDFLEDVLQNREVTKVDVTPLGTPTNAYKSRSSDVEIWLKKLKTINSDKLGVVDV